MVKIEGTFADVATESETIVVTATRIAQHNYKIAGNVTVITRDEIEASNAQNVPDILKMALGFMFMILAAPRPLSWICVGWGIRPQKHLSFSQ